MIHIVDKIKSTNSWLSENFQGMSDMILAFQQLEGRGRRGNDWESIYGGLYFSLVSPSHKLLPFISGISVVQTLNRGYQSLHFDLLETMSKLHLVKQLQKLYLN